jgi:hypothetical protein
MIRRRFLLLGAILAGIAMTGLAPSARADFEVVLSDGIGDSFVANQSGVVSHSGNGAGTVFIASQNNIGIFAVTIGGFSVTFDVSTNNSPGTDSLATMNLTNTTISYKTFSNNATATLTITESTAAGSFTGPTINPVNLNSALTSTMSGGTIDLTTSIVGGVSDPTISNSPSVANATSTVVVANHTTPFDLQNVFHISLSNGGSISTMDGSAMLTAPAPTSMSMGLVGLGTLAVSGWYRRARKSA